MFCFVFSSSWRRGSSSAWLLAERTVHVEMSGEKGGAGNRKCQVLRGQDRGDGEREAAASGGWKDGHRDMFEFR